MTSLETELDGFGFEESTAVTVAEGHRTLSSCRSRQPEDSIAEKIVLRRSGACGPGGGEAQFVGPTSWFLAELMITAWGSCCGGEDPSIEFTVTFGDGLAFRGSVNPLRKRERNLARHVRQLATFRASFCVDLSDTQAAAMHKVFLDQYEIPRVQTVVSKPRRAARAAEARA